MENYFKDVPDTIVTDDIKNYLSKKTDKHFFSDIYKGRTVLRPNDVIEFYYNKDIITLYQGSLGMGNYITVEYSTRENKYIYYTINSNEKPRENFKSDNWEEFHTYVRKELLDLLIWFNDVV